MPVKCSKYPNKGVWLDPRSITSAKMPESSCMVKGQIKHIFKYCVKEGYCTPLDISARKELICDLKLYNQTGRKMESSIGYETETHVVEFFRTSKFNYKVYALERFL